MNNIPNAVHIRNFVGEKLHDIKSARDADDPPVIEHVQPARQVDRTETLQKSENGDRRVKINAGRPRRAQCQTQSRKPFHRFTLRLNYDSSVSPVPSSSFFMPNFSRRYCSVLNVKPSSFADF